MSSSKISHIGTSSFFTVIFSYRPPVAVIIRNIAKEEVRADIVWKPANPPREEVWVDGWMKQRITQDSIVHVPCETNSRSKLNTCDSRAAHGGWWYKDCEAYICFSNASYTIVLVPKLNQVADTKTEPNYNCSTTLNTCWL